MFTELVRDVVAEDWEAECGFRTKWSSTGEEVDVLHSHARTDSYFNTYFGTVKLSLQYVYPCIHFGDQSGDFQHRRSGLKISWLLEIFQMFHIHMYLNRFVVSHRCHNSSCSGCGSPGSGAVVQHRSSNPQEESTLLQGGVAQTTVTHVPKY